MRDISVHTSVKQACTRIYNKIKKWLPNFEPSFYALQNR